MSKDEGFDYVPQNTKYQYDHDHPQRKFLQSPVRPGESEIDLEKKNSNSPRYYVSFEAPLQDMDGPKLTSDTSFSASRDDDDSLRYYASFEAPLQDMDRPKLSSDTSFSASRDDDDSAPNDTTVPPNTPSTESERWYPRMSPEEYAELADRCRSQSWTTVVKNHVTRYKLGYFGVLCVIAAYAIQRSK